jgi:hypothetical protein
MHPDLIYDQLIPTGKLRVQHMGKRESEGNIHTLDDFITVDMGVEQKLFNHTTFRVNASNIF